MKSWSWLSPSRQHSTDNSKRNLAAPDLPSASGEDVNRSPTTRQTELSSDYPRLPVPMLQKAQRQIGMERMALCPSPSLSFASMTRTSPQSGSASSTMEEPKDRQGASRPSTRISVSRKKGNENSSYRMDVTPQLESDSASSIMEEHKDQLVSVTRELIPAPKKIAKRKNGTKTEVTPQLVLADPPAEVDPRRPSEAHWLNRSNSTGPDTRAPLTLPRRLPILPALMERFRKKHIGTPANDPTEFGTARSSSYKTHRSTPFLTSPELGPEESFSDGFSDVFATASSHRKPSPKTVSRSEDKRPDVQLRRAVRCSPSKSPEVHYSSSSSLYSFRHHSPSHLSIQAGLNEEEEETCILEHSSDTKILDHNLTRSSTGTESHENIVEFSGSDIDESDFQKPEQVIRTNKQAPRNKFIQPLRSAEPSRQQSQEFLLSPSFPDGKNDDGMEPDVPEWVKLISSRMGFSPPKMSKFLRKS